MSLGCRVRFYSLYNPAEHERLISASAAAACRAISICACAAATAGSPSLARVYWPRNAAELQSSFGVLRMTATTYPSSHPHSTEGRDRAQLPFAEGGRDASRSSHLADSSRRSRYRRDPGRSLAWRAGRAGHSRPGSQGRRELASCAGAIPAGRRRNATDGGTAFGATADRSHAQLRRCPDRAGRPWRDRRACPARGQGHPARWRQGAGPGSGRCKGRMGHHCTGPAADRRPT